MVVHFSQRPNFFSITLLLTDMRRIRTMLSLEKLNDYIDRLGITNVAIAEHYIKDDGKPATKQFIGQIRNGKDAINVDAYKKLVKAINGAQQASK